MSDAATPAVATPAAPVIATVPSAAPAAVTPAASPAPVAPTPEATPAAAAATADPAAAPTTEAAPEPASPDAPPSLLGDAGKPPATPEVAPAVPEAPPAPEAVPALTYEFKWPEGVTAPQPEELKPFTEILGGAKVPPEVGQKLVDLHLAETTKLVERIAKQNETTWNDTRREWVEQIKADPDIGGNRFQTAIQQAGTVIENYGGTAEQKAELRRVLNFTGAGDHPALVRLFANLGRVLSEGKPVPAATPVPQPTGRAHRRYAGTMTNGAA